MREHSAPGPSDSGAAEPVSIPTTTVVATVQADMFLQNENKITLAPFQLLVRHLSTDPFAVHTTIISAGGTRSEWVFAHALLTEALTKGSSGEGMVQLRAGHSPLTGAAGLYLRLYGRDACAEFFIQGGDLAILREFAQSANEAEALAAAGATRELSEALGAILAP